METSTKKEPSTTLIYVSNLPFDTNDEQLRELFKGFGIKTAYVAKRKNGKSKGFGFVNLEKDSDQNAAIERVNGKELSSRKLIAKIAYNDDRRNENGELREEFKTLTQNRSAPSETVVHVSNLEWTVNDETLRGIFAEFNPKVATVATRRSGKSKGFGFVEFNTKEDQEKALKLNGTSISNRNITVQASTGFKREGGSNENRPRRNNNNNRDSNRPRRNNDNRNDNRSDNRSNNRRNNDNRNDNRFNVVRRNDRNENRPERRSENTLYISNLPFELDDNDLRQIFQEFNPKNAHIPTRRNGKSRGYGFVEFNNGKEQIEAQKALDQSEVNGRVVTIKVSQPGSGNRDNNNRVTVRRNNNNNDNRRDNRNNNNNRNNDRNNDNRRDNRNNNNNRNNDNRRNNNNNDNRRDNRNNNNNRTTRPPRNNENREISNTLVYVSNLPFSVDDKGLEEVFKGLKLNKAYVARRRNGYSKGFGFVEFSSAEDQKKAISQHGNEVNGRAIVVQAAFKVDEKQQQTITTTQN